MQKSTRQFTLSNRQALSPLVRIDYELNGVSDKGENFKDLNEMQKSTRQLTLSSGHVLSPLVRIDYKLHGVSDKPQNF